MKIVQVVTQMEAGGAQRVASLLTDGLRQRGHQAQLWFLYKKRSTYQENSYTQCLSLGRPSGAGWLGTAARLWRRLREERPDVTLTHTHSSNAFGSPIAALAGVPVRVAVHHNPLETYSPIWRAADKLAFKAGCYSAMVTVSGGVRQSFTNRELRFRSRLHRIYNGIERTTASEHENIRIRYRVPAQHAVLVNVGRLAEQKNQGLLFGILREIPMVTLLLVGEGERGIELRRKADSSGVADRVRFTGELPPRDVAAILSQADLFVLPSLYESFCLAAVEAMQHGLPVIASDLPCLREVLGDGQMFFQVRDEGAMIDMVKSVLSTPRLRVAMGNAGRARAECFSVERMVGEYEILLSEEIRYVSGWDSAADDLRRLDGLGGVPRVHDHL